MKAQLLLLILLVSVLAPEADGVQFTAKGTIRTTLYLGTGETPVLKEGETNSFTVAVKDDLYLITGTNANGICIFAVGTDGKYVYTLDQAYPVGQSGFISDTPEGCHEMGQILWVAFASQLYWNQNTNENLIRLNSFEINKIEPTDTQLKILNFLPGSKLPEKIEFIGPNYVVLEKGVKSKFNPPYDHGYLWSQYQVNQSKVIDGMTFPAQFEYKGFDPILQPKTMRNVRIGIDRQFQVTSFDTNCSVVNFLPAIESSALYVHDQRIKEKSHRNSVYEIEDKKWPATDGGIFKRIAEDLRYTKQFEDRQKHQPLLRKVLIAVLVGSMLFAPLVYWRWRKSTRETN